MFKICAQTGFFSSYHLLNKKFILFINTVWLNEIPTSWWYKEDFCPLLHSTVLVMYKCKSQATNQMSKSHLFYSKTPKHPSLSAQNQIDSYKNF